MNESEFPKVSVIIPVYNVRNYLRKCLDSVINQSLREIEIILIDDGSTDGSGKICDEYAAQDNRIQVFHEPNEGLSCARNNGISISTAPFIMFVDADDWVEQRFCELPYKAAINHHSDMVLITHNTVDQDGNIKQPKIGMQEGPLSEAEAMCYNVTISNAAWLALYSRRLFDGNSFPENRYYEDVGVIFDFKMNCDDRGSFTELVRTPDRGQVSINISKPGITKGQHWHDCKNEIFIVVKGQGLIQMRNLKDNEVEEYEVSGDHIQGVWMKPGWTHNIINLSDTEDLVTVMWASEMLDKNKPDTFFEKV